MCYMLVSRVLIRCTGLLDACLSIDKLLLGPAGTNVDQLEAVLNEIGEKISSHEDRCGVLLLDQAS